MSVRPALILERLQLYDVAERLKGKIPDVPRPRGGWQLGPCGSTDEGTCGEMGFGRTEDNGPYPKVKGWCPKHGWWLR